MEDSEAIMRVYRVSRYPAGFRYAEYSKDLEVGFWGGGVSYTHNIGSPRLTAQYCNDVT